MTEITDEMVTAALVALFRNGWRTSPLAMRDALSAVSPMIAAQEREQCAALVDTFQAEVQANIDDNIARVRVVQSEPDDNSRLIRARDWLAHAAAAIRQEPGHE